METSRLPILLHVHALRSIFVYACSWQSDTERQMVNALMQLRKQSVQNLVHVADERPYQQ